MILPRLHLPRPSRTHWIGILLLCGGIAVGLRLSQLMVVEHHALDGMARAQAEDMVEIPGPRGDIVDRHGRLLATSVPIQVLAIEPRKVSQSGLAQLEAAAGVPGRLTKRAMARWLLVRRDCDDQVVAAVNDLAAKKIVPAEALHWGPGFRRMYPHGELAAHVLGFVTLDESLAEGVEKTYDHLLRSGETRVLRATDARRQQLGGLGGSACPASASSLMLTIDIRIQEKLEAALKQAVEEHSAKSAQGIVVDPGTGEILALANYPAYDPNKFNQVDQELLRNRAIEWPFEPGSVMKPLTATALAEYHKVGYGDTVYCEAGHWKRGKWTISDSHPHGTLTIAEVIAYSSNIGIAKFAQRLTGEQLYTTLTGLGLGARSGVDLPAENGGRLASWKQWHGTDRDVIAFGHSLMLTTMQLAQAYATIAHGGVRVQPHVARAWGSPDGQWHETRPAPSQRVVSEEAAGQVALWMLGVVEGPGGTGHKAAVDGYRVAGKTGTAEKLVGGHYDKTKNISTFAGFAPLENPAAVVTISLDEPMEGGRTGGAVSAPAFADVMAETLRLLHVEPDYYMPPAVDAPVKAQQAKSDASAAAGRGGKRG